jgi:hypothetical protein
MPAKAGTHPSFRTGVGGDMDPGLRRDDVESWYWFDIFADGYYSAAAFCDMALDAI